MRRIPGIDAIEEAIGRATEMGRPVLYIPGIQDIDDIQTVAGARDPRERRASSPRKYETPITRAGELSDPVHDRRRRW